MKTLKLVAATFVATQLLAACGGGGGGGSTGGSTGGSGGTLYYPYETVYGEVCQTEIPTPGCTFFRGKDQRIDVKEDSDYNRFGRGSDDLWYVKIGFDEKADVYDSTGKFQYSTHISAFKGYISGSTIGVGTTSLFWENVAGKTYWYGKTGVLYSTDKRANNYGRAINTNGADAASDTNFSALSSEANVALVKSASAKLQKDYGLAADKATAVASALNKWGVASVERGYTTATDMDKTFKAVFGVDFNNALAAVKDLQNGDVEGMRDMTERSAAALGLKPHQAQQFVKGMYRKALAQYGYDVDSINW